MKQLTREEFIDRSAAVLRSRRIFIDSGVTKNLTVAFELYQKVVADTERNLMLTQEMVTGLDHLPAHLRPKCPHCDDHLFLRKIRMPKGRWNRNGYRCCWECMTCGHEQYSLGTVEEEIAKRRQGANL